MHQEPHEAPERAQERPVDEVGSIKRSCHETKSRGAGGELRPSEWVGREVQLESERHSDAFSGLSQASYRAMIRSRACRARAGGTPGVDASVA